MSGCWQQPNWRTATSCRISSQWHPGSHHCIHFCHQGSQLYIFPRSRHVQTSMLIIPVQTTVCLQSQPRWTEYKWLETPAARCVTQRKDPSLLCDREFISISSMCHPCHQSQKVKVTECVVWSMFPQIPVSSSGIFLWWCQWQCVTDEAMAALSLGSTLVIWSIKTIVVAWK